MERKVAEARHYKVITEGYATFASGMTGKFLSVAAPDRENKPDYHHYGAEPVLHPLTVVARAGVRAPKTQSDETARRRVRTHPPGSVQSRAFLFPRSA